jgi:hypothetical protein
MDSVWDTIDFKVQHLKLVKVEEAAKAIWFYASNHDVGL